MPEARDRLMGNIGLCSACSGSRVRWTGDRLVWCRCSGRTGPAPDPVKDAGQTWIPVPDWSEMRDRLLGRR